MILTVALLLVPLLIGAALVIDLGTGYSTGRQMQNAADAASLAGARQLALVKYSGAASSTVDATASSVATTNGADATRVTCVVITANKTPIGPCSTAANVTNVLAAGVQVTTGHKFSTSFANVIGVGSIAPSRSAAATIQTLESGDAPLYACAFDQTDDKNKPSPDLLVDNGGTYVVNAAAVGQKYFLHGPSVSKCGLGSNSWKGDAGPGPFTLPGWLPIATGVKAGPIRTQIAGQPGCGGSYPIGCVLLLPICTESNGGTGINGELYCVTWGVFQLVSQNGPNKQTFSFVGGATVTGGQGGTQLPGANDPRLIKLVQ